MRPRASESALLNISICHNPSLLSCSVSLVAFSGSPVCNSQNVVWTGSLWCMSASESVAVQARLPVEKIQERKQAFVDELKSMPIAICTDVANEQHYEV
jgi:hypothetical protein